MLLGSACVKAAHKMLVKFTPGEAVAVEARHGGHDDGGGRRGWSSHRQSRKTIVVVRDAVVPLVMLSATTGG